MVKLFVGNLGPTTKCAELRALFEKYGTVTECDVIRNYGFVHMKNEDDAAKACSALNNQVLDGKAIHIEFSTSKLRKAPGMDEVCFRCGEQSHKTKNCPMHDMIKDRKTTTITNGSSSKRPYTEETQYPPPKRVECYFTPSKEAASSGLAYSYLKAASTAVAPAPAPVIKRESSVGNDPLLPRPLDRNLSSLYDEYLAARDRYYYLRDRLTTGNTYVPGATNVARVGGLQQTAVIAPTAYVTQPIPMQQQVIQAMQQTRIVAAQPAIAAQAPMNVDYYGAAPSRASPLQSRYVDIYYKPSNGYESASSQRVAYQPGAAPAASAHPPDVYYHRTESGYEAFTMPSVASGTASHYI
uniref:Uncharacterized protein n=1 Tax=Romanomermis culicivorax TaxID=13658 RepID=A0A915JHT0_ROMCU